ncbi:hypothetical protein K439DRAFT_1620802 [Ramaria rubella]|nr:hypothetical protein K439DRAFT_1620802 [Ramaria rubella]
MSRLPSRLDVESLDKTQFHSAYWISNGKEYPREPHLVPNEVVVERMRLLKIPGKYMSLLPDSTLTVKDAIAFKLPEVEQAVLIQDTTTKLWTAIHCHSNRIGDLVLPAQSFQLWQEMQRALRAVKVAVKAITARSKNVEGRDED